MQHSRSRKGPVVAKALLGACLLASALCLTACGVGTGDFDPGLGTGPGIPSGGVAQLQILTTTLPAGSRDVSYPQTPLAVSGARGPVTWTVAEGSLPAGLALTESGRLVGTPAEKGFFTFTARATDGLDADLQALAVAVDTFGVAIVDGLQFGDAWSGRAVNLSCSGFSGPVEMEVVVNASGGVLQSTDGTRGDATYVPGEAPASGVSDFIRATDTGTGATAEVEISVLPDPAASHVARFGSTDVWYVDFGVKSGAHAYASDFQNAMAGLGLRGPASTDRLGTEADRLAEMLVRVRALEYLNQMYLRNEDGTGGAAGLPISFPLEKPGAGFLMPAAGGYTAATANQFNVMAVCDGTDPYVVGTAYTDGAGNGLQEHNAPGGALGELGTFVNNILPMVRAMYRLHGSELEQAPVTDDDLDVLRALLYDLPDAGGRTALLDYTSNALARCVAYIAAHEIGHSLGLPHATSWEPGAIMDAGATFSPLVEYHFLPEALSMLRANLPGAGRTYGSQAAPGSGGAVAAATLLPAGGIHVCGGACQGR